MWVVTFMASDLGKVLGMIGMEILNTMECGKRMTSIHTNEILVSLIIR